MSAEEPKHRLRAARRNRGLSRLILGSIVGLSQSAVAAHENGQNNIPPDVAARYAAALNVTPEWLLFGAGKQDAPTLLGGNASIAQIPLIGKIQFGVWDENASVPSDLKVQSYIPFSVDDLDVIASDRHLGPIAFEVGPGIAGYRSGSIVVAALPAEVGLRDGDHAVTQRLSTDRGALETTLHLVEGFNGGLLLTPLALDPRRQQRFCTPLKLETAEEFAPAAAKAKLPVDENVELMAVVIGYQDMQRKGGGVVLA